MKYREAAQFHQCRISRHGQSRRAPRLTRPPPLPPLPLQIPDGLTNHYLKLSGIKEPDVRITRLISLAAQSFVAQIAADAHQCATRRVEMQAREKRERGYDPKDKRIVMTMEDVSAALGERGVHVRKPQYFEGSADEPEPGESGKEGAAAKKRR